MPTSVQNGTVTVEVYKASSVGNDNVPDLQLSATREPPKDDPERPFRTSPAPLRQIYLHDACAIADALFQSLPGGTIDELLAEMMSRRASLLRVPHYSTPAPVLTGAL